MRVPSFIAVLIATATTPVSAQIVADFVADKLVGVTPMYVHFTNLSTYPPDGNVEFLWDFGDGTSGVGKNVSHVYTFEGNFSVSMAIHMDEAIVATKTREAYITTYEMVVDFGGGPRIGTPPFSVTFWNLTSTEGVFPTTYLWEFGDGKTRTATNPAHTYDKAGLFSVTLHATADGKTVSETKSEYVTSVVPQPSFSAVPRSGSLPLDVQFANHTKTLGLPVTYRWEFGDGATSSALHPSHRYLAPGIYTVSLHASVVGGATFTHTEIDYIEAILEADFTGTPLLGRAPLQVQFTDLTYGVTDDTTYEWDFGDGNRSNSRDPVHTYEHPGVYSVSLTANLPSEDPLSSTKNDYIFVHNFAPDAHTYFIAFPEAHIQQIDYSTVEEVDLLLTISSAVTANGKVEFPGLPFTKGFTVNPADPVEVEVPLDAMMQGSNTIMAKGGVVTADAPLRVYGLIRQNQTTDGFAALPKDALSNTYRTASTPPETSQFTILSTSPETLVVVEPTATSGQLEAGVPFVVHLGYLDVYQLQFSQDSGGSLIAADRPIAVYSGNKFATVSGDGTETLVEQVPPLPAWGQEFVVVSLAMRTNGDVVRLVAHEDNTSVTIAGSNPEIFVLQAGQSATRTLTGINRITSLEPVLVTQYAKSAASSGSVNGDPFMMNLVPDDRFLSQYTLKTPRPPANQSETEYLNFANLIVQQADVDNGAIKVDSNSIAPASFVPVPGTTYAAARVELAHGIHRFESHNPFGVYLYGFAHNESYGYHGGMSYAGLEPPPQLTADDVLHLRSMFVEYDANGDAGLSRSEITSASFGSDFFGALDLNQDGFITVAELLALSAGQVGVTTPVYLDFGQPSLGRGTQLEPFNRLNEAQVFVKTGGAIHILGGSSPETFAGSRRLVKPIRVQSESSEPVTVGGAP